ncbi:MAG: UDP-glucose/GDP-mannose dehydrogenase family protein [Candidatus Woesebacteria bacterium]
MNLTIIGTGFVGVVSAAVFASLGNTVIGLDIDPKRVKSLQAGKVPFYEPDLEELLLKTQKKGTLSFTTSYKEAVSSADVIFIAVGTPSAADGQADLQYVFAAAKSLSSFVKEKAVVVIKSTVPPGTCDKVKKILSEKDVYVASVPEFLKEGAAVADTLHPDRIIIGAKEPGAIAILKKLHKPLGAQILVMQPESAQMAKYAANSYLATRITFINQIANLCEENGANILEVIKAIGMDKRIGSQYWYPGLGYGGSCFPKDVKELAAYAKAVGQTDNLMVTVSKLNEERITKLFKRFARLVGGFSNKKVAVLGLSFKPNTDDMREAPSTKIIPMLLDAGAAVTGFDPMANSAAKKVLPKEMKICSSATQAMKDADVVIILVEWKELITLSLTEIAKQVKAQAYFIDIRDQYQKSEVENTGMKYLGIGIE